MIITFKEMLLKNYYKIKFDKRHGLLYAFLNGLNNLLKKYKLQKIN